MKFSFGKPLQSLKIYDFIFIFCTALLLIAVLVVFGKKDREIKIQVKIRTNDYKNVNYSQLNNSPFKWAVQNISIGDSEQNSIGQTIARVIDIQSWGDLLSETWITVMVRVKYDKNRQTFKYSYQNVSIGQPIKLNLGHTVAEGVITHIDGVKDDRKYENVVVKTKLMNFNIQFQETTGVFPWVAQAVKSGDKMINASGEVVAEVKSVEIVPAQKTVITNSGQTIITTDPQLKDVYITLVLKTHQKNGTNYFLEDWPVKIDYDIPFFVKAINLFPRITEILPSTE